MKRFLLFSLIALTCQIAYGQGVGGNGVPGAGNGSATIPATSNVLKGAGSAGAATAATPGVDYIAPSPGGVNQTVNQTGGSVLGVTNLNKVFHVSGFPSSCATNEGSFTTQLECAWFTAFDYAVANTALVELDMGYGYYAVNHSLYEPTTNFTGISLVGSGVEGGSVILANAALSDAVIYKNETNAGATWPQLNFRDFSINGQDQAQGCMRLWGVQNPVIKNVGCSGIPNGAPFFYQFGEPNNYGQGWVFGGIFDNVGAANNGTISLPAVASRAVITPTVSGGGIATNGYVVSSGGTGYPQPSAEVTLGVYLLGNRSGTADTPCSTMPTGLAATVNGSGVITGVTSTTAASGCSGSIYVAILPQTNLTIAGEDIWASDSRLYNSSVYGVGTCFNTHSGNTLFAGLHPTNCGVGIVAVANGGGSSNAVFRDTELDTLVKWGFDFQGTGPSATVEGTNTFGNFPSSFSPFHIGSSAPVIFGPQADLTTASTTTDYHEFLMPYGTYEAQGYLPAGTSVCPNDVVGSNLGCILEQPATLAPQNQATSSNNYSSNILNFGWSSWNSTIPQTGTIAVQAVPNGALSGSLNFSSQIAGSAFDFGNSGNSPVNNIYFDGYVYHHFNTYSYGTNYLNQTAGNISYFGTSNQLSIDSSGDVNTSGSGEFEHLIGGSPAPTVSAGSGAGTSPTLTVVSGATDLSGYVTLTTGTTPAASATVFTLTFNTAYGSTPKCFAWPANVATQALVGVAAAQIFPANSTTAHFLLTQGATALTASTAYEWGYQCTQ